MNTGRTSGSDVLRHLLVAALWVAAFRLVAEHAVRLIPLAVARQLSLQTYLTLAQLVTAGLGLGLAALVLPRPRASLGLEAAPARRLLVLTFSAVAVYVAASYAAIYAALPTLLEELRAGGRQAVQQSSGEFGRELVGSGLLLAIVWGVVVSPVCEELMFRGGVWSAAQTGINALRERLARPELAASSNALPEGVLETGSGLKAWRMLSGGLLGGGLATLVSAAVFAAMHADMPGGLGIVRWVSALGLGLAAGTARQLSGGVAGAMVVHVVFNLCALATTRRWLVGETFGQKLGVPTLLSLIAAIAGVAALGIALSGRRRRSS
ncbi:MAG: CPBP family intramembrane metalloprotease [Myxococcales bacterium]|nr:CPBP family intramembrane metalloprotease [Myxococcales bacterium]